MFYVQFTIELYFLALAFRISSEQAREAKPKDDYLLRFFIAEGLGRARLLGSVGRDLCLLVS